MAHIHQFLNSNWKYTLAILITYTVVISTISYVQMTITRLLINSSLALLAMTLQTLVEGLLISLLLKFQKGNFKFLK